MPRQKKPVLVFSSLRTRSVEARRQNQVTGPRAFSVRGTPRHPASSNRS